MLYVVMLKNKVTSQNTPQRELQVHITIKATAQNQQLATRISQAIQKELFPLLNRGPSPQWQSVLDEIEARFCANHELVFDKATP